jgi:hypothetical protein
MIRDISLPSVHSSGETPQPAGKGLKPVVSLDIFAGA